MVEFQSLQMEHRKLVNGYLRRFPPQISEHTFTNLFAWRKSRPVLWAEWEGVLLVAQQQDDGRRALLGPPVGEYEPAPLLEALKQADVNDFKRLPNPDARRLQGDGVSVRKDRANSDYVYRREDLAELEGRRYHRQKNLVNQCLSSYDCQYETMSADVVEQVRQMQDRWCDEQDCDETPGLCDEYNAIQQVLDHFEQFDLRGGLVRIDGQVQAYTIGEGLTSDTAVVHFEKAMKRYSGLYQVINQWFVQHELKKFEFVNREQDLGIAGLRKAKKSYHPDHMVTKYVATREPGRLPELVGAEHGE